MQVACTSLTSIVVGKYFAHNLDSMKRVEPSMFLDPLELALEDEAAETAASTLPMVLVERCEAVAVLASGKLHSDSDPPAVLLPVM